MHEKIFTIFGTIFFIITIFLMGHVFRVKIDYMVALTIVLLTGETLIFGYEFYKKRKFYKEFDALLKELEPKYLITEMVSSPDFFEGRFMMEALYDINKSMLDNINIIEKRYTDFKEYLEMWIHEIKVPISALGLMNYNKNTDLPKQKLQIDKMKYYVEQILFYARAGAPEKDYLLKECNLEQIINKVVMNNKDLLIGNRINIQKDQVDKCVITDSKWLEFMVGQIVNNSIKYIDSDKNPYIKFYVQKLDEQIVLSIEDNGIGISVKDLPCVFDKTFTGENGRKNVTSTGMGLYICQKLCQKLGHKIEIESKETEFTRVNLYFGINNHYFLQQEK